MKLCLLLRFCFSYTFYIKKKILNNSVSSIKIKTNLSDFLYKEKIKKHTTQIA